MLAAVYKNTINWILSYNVAEIGSLGHSAYKSERLESELSFKPKFQCFTIVSVSIISDRWDTFLF